VSKSVLLIFAHPDDEVLGCGGTVAKLIKDGFDVATLILGEGKTSRFDNQNVAEAELKKLSAEIVKANKRLGISRIFTSDFPDNKFDSIPLLYIVKKIEEIKQIVKPSIVFTHHFGDMNIDHQLTYKAVLTATRPMSDECVQEIYACEIPSSTEWNFESGKKFTPNVFIDVTETIDVKVEAMREYSSELREWPFPRSLRHIKDLASLNGVNCGLNYAEAFMLVRSVRKKSNNIVGE
jgi:LmbE family N-acetylglucosaminyl deacetylase